MNSICVIIVCILCILIVLGFIITFYVRTYNNIHSLNMQRQRQDEVDISLNRKINDSSKYNEEKLKDYKIDILKKIDNITEKIDVIDLTLQTKIDMVKEKIKNTDQDVKLVDERLTNEILQLNSRIPESIVTKEEIATLLQELEDKLGGEIEILNDVYGSLNDKVDTLTTDFADYNNFKKETDEILQPMSEQVQKEKIKIADYVVNYDKATRKLRTRNNNLDDHVDGIDVLNADVGKTMTIAHGGQLNFATIDTPYELITGNEELNISLPKNTSQVNLKRKNAKKPAHIFLADGLAKHDKRVESPSFKVGNFQIIEKNGQLIVQDETNMNENIIS